jgi:hypothetical protein
MGVKVVFDVEGKSCIKGVWEQGAEKNIWTEEDEIIW